MSRKVYIHCDGGLGRRYNSLLSGITLAHALRCEYYINWPLNNDCSCPLWDLFGAQFNLCDPIPTAVTPLSNIFFAPNGLNSDDYSNINDVVATVSNTGGDILYSSYNIPRWVMNTGMYEITNTVLQFKPSILNRASAFIEQHQLSPKFHGLHIRKTDRLHFPERDFFYNLIQHNSKQRFFVCSDERDAELDFAALPNVAIHPKSEWVRKLNANAAWSDYNLHRSRISIIDAAVDLVILSRSQIINTAKNSSFLQLAVLLNGYNNYIVDTVPPELRLGVQVVKFNPTTEQ